MSGTDYNTTPNLGLYKPIYNADPENWGTHLNSNADTLDAHLATSGGTAVFLPLAGGTMLGPIALPADPVTALGVATKQYVDAHAFTDAPNNTNVYGRSGAAWVQVVGLGGASMTGPLILSGDPATAQQAATKAYVDNKPVGALVGDTPPVSPTQGELWWCSADGQLYCYYTDPNSSQWTAASTFSGDATAQAISGHNSGRSFIHNGLFNIAQRGTGPWSSTGYTLDRWAINTNLDVVTVTANPLSDADRTGIGDETARQSLTANFAGNSGAAALSFVYHAIEDTRRLAGKAVTISFWAVAMSGTPKLGINMAQTFGTGGSPSAGVGVLATGSSLTLSTTWTRYSTTIVIPSVTGKTFGTNNNSYTNLQIFYSSGATNNATAGNIGVQTAIIQLWGVQLEIGSVATPLDYGGSPQQQLAECQRFYQIGQIVVGSYQVAASGIQATYTLAVQMRASPTVTSSNNANSNISGFAMSA
ncbi:MAG TPA: hypothetical protein VGH84_00720, partial [Steroidobacteraceae bacterium]